MSGPWLQEDLVSLGDVSSDDPYRSGIAFGEVDGWGVEWILTGLSGWNDMPGSTATVEQRSGAHGGWRSPDFLVPRVMELSGTLIARDGEAAEEAVERLMAAIPLGAPTRLEVANRRRVLWAMVYMEGDPLSERIDHHADFSLSLIATDPRRYASEPTVVSTGLPSTTGGLSLPISPPFSIPAVVTGGVLVTENKGNMTTPPRLTVTGPCPPFSITHAATGRTLRFHDPVAAGETVVIDPTTREATVDGAPRYLTGAPFEYAPGVNGLAFNAASYNPGALLTSTHYDALR